MNELTYFEIVEIWATMANYVEDKQKIEKGMTSEVYSASVRSAESLLAKLVEIKNAAWEARLI